jgi:uncharacterized protein (TIGR00730 family)
VAKRFCVYCGSSVGTDPEFSIAAENLGQLLVRNNIELVYGGANRGLMTIVADTVLAAGGKAYGVMPEPIADLEVAHDGLTELHITSSMHERKALMADMSDGFIALPGGLGTLEELFEIWTWGQLRFHDKPIGLLNTAGFFDSLLQFLDHAAGSGFVRSAHREMLTVSTDAGTLIQGLLKYKPPVTRKLD